MGTELAQSIKKTENGQPEAATEGRTGTRQTDTGATGWKTEVKAELKAHRGRLIVCALIGILLLAFLISHKNVFEEPWGTNINLAADYGTIPLQEGHELSQSFRSEGQHLDQLFLWIEGAASAGDPGEAQGVIYFRSSGSGVYCSGIPALQWFSSKPSICDDRTGLSFSYFQGCPAGADWVWLCHDFL